MRRHRFGLQAELVDYEMEMPEWPLKQVSCKSGTLRSDAYLLCGFSDAAMALAPAASPLSYWTSTMQTLSPAGIAR